MWKKNRIPFLILTCGFVLITLANITLHANKVKQTKNTSRFLDRVSLKG
jgi:hypothetical protein